MIHKLKDGSFVISSHGSWLPGAYDTERAAKYAFRFTDYELSDLNAEPGVITFKMLQQKRRERS